MQYARNIRLSGTTLSAECYLPGTGYMPRSSIDLNNCIANDGGKLIWCEGGNFAATSDQITLSGKSLTARCSGGFLGFSRTSSIDLEDCPIDWSSGKLAFDKYSPRITGN